MNNIRFIFSPSILRFELIPLILVTISVLLMIIITTVLVNKELKKRGLKNEKKNK